MLDRLQSIVEDLIPDRPWKPVSRPALVACLIFYAGFLVYAFNAHGQDSSSSTAANLVVHEGGHNLFSWFGPTTLPLGRHAAAVAGPISSGCVIFFKRTLGPEGFVFFPVFLF